MVRWIYTFKNGQTFDSGWIDMSIVSIDTMAKTCDEYNTLCTSWNVFYK